MVSQGSDSVSYKQEISLFWRKNTEEIRGRTRSLDWRLAPSPRHPKFIHEGEKRTRKDGLRLGEPGTPSGFFELTVNRLRLL